jgi:Protein kinase domain
LSIGYPKANIPAKEKRTAQPLAGYSTGMSGVIKVTNQPAARRDVSFRHLQRRWEELCAEYLPVIDDDSIWRCSRLAASDDLDQGWKLHVSVTILNAPQVLAGVAPVLRDRGVQFKAARTLNDVQNLNAGLSLNYSQIGKIITVYPRNDDECVLLARRLHQLTYRFRAPSVPFDLRLTSNSNIYYRYGAFKRMQVERDGGLLPVVKSPSGEWLPDRREIPNPDWVSDPFQKLKLSTGNPSQQKTTAPKPFVVVRALVQRGKGGVYQAIDVQSQPPRLCLLKEGRRHGEVNWDGRDGAWRVRHEQRVLGQLSRAGIIVPQVYSRMEVSGNVYLTMEYVDGESLHRLLLRQNKRFSLKSILSFGTQLATLLAQMHRAGWAWRDCKPNNLIVNGQGKLVPIDFEGAERINRPDPTLWGTPGFVPRAARANAQHLGLTDDLYSLGAILFLLITGRMFDEAQPVDMRRLRRNLPPELKQLVESLLSAEPHKRPSAEDVQLQLNAISRKLPETRRRQAA